MWLFDAAVDHLNEYVGVFIEFDHKLLVLLHLSEAVLINDVSIVEEEIVLRSELNFDVLDVIAIISLYNFIRSIIWICHILPIQVSSLL